MASPVDANGVAQTSSRRVTNPFRRRRRPHPSGQTEIQPASGSEIGSRSPRSSFSQPATTIPDLIQQLRDHDNERLSSALSHVISLTKNPNEGVINEFVTNGALPVLMQILVKESFEIETRIRVAAAICNLSHARHALRSFFSCNAVALLVDRVIGEHQALTGAVALMFRAMLISENLVHAMVECDAPMLLLRGLMLCTNLDISDTVIDVLIQMTTIEEIKQYLVKNRAVESCVYFLHVLARSHYFTSIQSSEQFFVNNEDSGPPSFTYKSMRDALIWALLHPEGSSSPPPMTIPSPEMMFFMPKVGAKDWEAKLKSSPVIGTDDHEKEFTQFEHTRAALFMEFLTCLLDSSPEGCVALAGMQFSLDILAYWIRRGQSIMKQGGLLTTCYLLRNGHRGFVTLRDVVSAISSVLHDTDPACAGVSFCKYKCVAAEVVNDLSIFGGENVRIAISAAGILRPLLTMLEVPDFQLQHLTLRALHTVCVHPIALAEIVSYGAIPFLCQFLEMGLKDAQTTDGLNCIQTLSSAARGCLSRKRVATVSMTQAEIELSQQQEQDYSRVRRLEYCAALLRCIAAVQCAEWIHDCNKSRIIPITLDALIQNYSIVMRKQALGILASLVTLRDANASTVICLEGGCGFLLNLKNHIEKQGDPEAPYWVSWINFVLYYLAQGSKTRKFVESAVRQHYGEALSESRETSILKRLKPEQGNLHLEWIASVT